jgi:hypothetical protein
MVSWFDVTLRSVLDFALPPRCAGCGSIVDDVHSFLSGLLEKGRVSGKFGLPIVRLAAPGN